MKKIVQHGKIHATNIQQFCFHKVGKLRYSSSVYGETPSPSFSLCSLFNVATHARVAYTGHPGIPEGKENRPTSD